MAVPTGCTQDQPVEVLACQVESGGDDALKTIRLLPDGEVKSRKGTFIVDATAARMVIDSFVEHGVDLPVDYEHQSVGGAYSSPDGRAPAAGWITRLFYTSGKGLFGTVKWNEAAKVLIRHDEYRYLSPVMLIRKADRRVVELDSVALTNVPAIPGMDRVAASGRRSDLEVVAMAKDGGPVDVMFMFGRIAAALGIDQEAKVGPEGFGSMLTAIVKAIEELKQKADSEASSIAGAAGDGTPMDLLRKIATVLGMSGKTAADVLAAVLEKLQKAGGADDGAEEEGDPVAASVRRELGLPRGAGADEVMVAMRGREQRGRDEVLASMRAEERDRSANAAVEALIADGKINPNDDAAREVALTVARRSPDDLAALMRDAPDLGPPQGWMKAPASAGQTGGRGSVIRTALQAFRADDALQRDTSAEAYVNLALRDEGVPLLEEGELTRFV